MLQRSSFLVRPSILLSSDHVAWRETSFNPYCVFDSSDESSLRWTDISTVNAVQPWRIAPAGCGIFFDIQSGSQLVIIATAVCSNDEGSKDFFTRWGRYLQGFEQLDPELFSENALEAIRLESGNRL